MSRAAANPAAALLSPPLAPSLQLPHRFWLANPLLAPCGSGMLDASVQDKAPRLFQARFAKTYTVVGEPASCESESLK